MNILGPAILEDEFLNKVFKVRQETIPSSLGLVYLYLEHDAITIKVIIDLDLDTGTLIRINDDKIRYHDSHTFESIPGMYVLIKSILEQYGLV